jgi:imidazolonepropionase
MHEIIIINIGKLYGVLDEGVHLKRGAEMSHVHSIENAWLKIKEDKISDFGLMTDLELELEMEVLDAGGVTITAGFIDSHTHLAFPASREMEFEMKIKGCSYEEIAAAGGGILRSADVMQTLSEEVLVQQAMDRIKQCISFGSVALEVKTGYGLTVFSEVKQMRVNQKLKQISPIPIKSTLLGAHAIPLMYKDKKEEYVDLVIQDMISLAPEYDVDYIDVFCETGFFSPEEAIQIMTEGQRWGLLPKIHANQLGHSGGVQAGVLCNALTVDHLEFLGDEEIEVLKSSPTLPVALPGCSFYLNMRYAPGRKIIDSGLPLVLASDFNPGSCPSSNLQFIFSLACIKMKLTPEEAFNALTINAAAAINMEKELGSITIGKNASLLFYPKGTTLSHIPYYFSMQKPEKVMINGFFYE